MKRFAVIAIGLAALLASATASNADFTTGECNRVSIDRPILSEVYSPSLHVPTLYGGDGRVRLLDFRINLETEHGWPLVVGTQFAYPHWNGNPYQTGNECFILAFAEGQWRELDWVNSEERLESVEFLHFYDYGYTARRADRSWE